MDSKEREVFRMRSPDLSMRTYADFKKSSVLDGHGRNDRSETKWLLKSLGCALRWGNCLWPWVVRVTPNWRLSGHIYPFKRVSNFRHHKFFPVATPNDKDDESVVFYWNLTRNKMLYANYHTTTRGSGIFKFIICLAIQD